MASYVPWSAVVWTLKGLFWTWRFFWVSPYHAIKCASWPPPVPDTIDKPHFQATPADVNLETERKGKPESRAQRERTSALHKRLLKAEEEIQELKIEISNQRASWEMRFIKLQRRQHDLRDQLTSEILVRSGILYKDADSEEASEVFTESGMENGLSEEKEQDGSGGLRHIQPRNAFTVEMLREDADQKSLCGSQLSYPSGVDVSNTSVRSWMGAVRPHRVFVPHSPLDLKIGHRVRVMLPSGRISVGTLQYLGYVQNSSDYHMGVELEVADNGEHDGTYEGQCYFQCEAGHGAFVAFSKLLMAWE
ncbi:uncharacterized protein [Paramisgurnus dabryanus]|uniref:uncharacterized protein n=1 Tax=Paramisgurnus dabryanus TaxID=90735 RepID=UPI003CCF2FD2